MQHIKPAHPTEPHGVAQTLCKMGTIIPPEVLAAWTSFQLDEALAWGSRQDLAKAVQAPAFFPPMTRYVVRTYCPGVRRAIGQAQAFTWIAPGDDAASVVAVALIGATVNGRAGPVGVCGVQLLRDVARPDVPTSDPANMNLVVEFGSLPSARHNRPRLTAAGLRHLRGVLSCSHVPQPSAGARSTITTLQQMGLLSIDGRAVTAFAMQLYGAQLGLSRIGTAQASA